MKTPLLIVLLVVLCAISASAQTQSVFVNPQLTDPQIDIFLSAHFVARNPSVTQRNQLLVVFPGTNGVPLNYRTFVTLGADLGFHAIGLTYVNDQGVNEICGPTLDLNCYGNVRMEIIDGTDRSTLVNVNRTNSIENRLIKLLQYMQSVNPAANWSQFLDSQNNIRWDKLVVAGHSQGGGHAGIVGKTYRVQRVIMFAAMDFSGVQNSVANWMLGPTATPEAAFYGFSHIQDEEVNYNILSTRAWPSYGMPGFGAPVNVENVSSPYSNTHSLNSNFAAIPVGSNYHGCIVVDTRFPVDINGVSIYEPVWRYLLNTSPAPTIAAIQFLRGGQPAARPPVGIASKHYRLAINGSGFAANTVARINGIEVETEFVSAGQVIARLPAGRIGSINNSSVLVRQQDGASSNALSY